MNAPYEAAPYAGKEWGLFHRPTRNWSVFGSRRAMQRRAAELNRLHTSQSELCAGYVRHLDSLSEAHAALARS